MNGFMYVAAGSDENYTLLNDVWSSSGHGIWWQLTVTAPFTPRGNARMVAYMNSLIFTGGLDGIGNRHNDIWSSVNGVTWFLVTIRAPFDARQLSSMTVFNNKIIIAAGAADNPLNDVWTFTVTATLARCICTSGWIGVNCTIDVSGNVNDCAGSPCKNGATCTDGIGSYMCSCAADWSGVNCTICATNSCINGCMNGATYNSPLSFTLPGISPALITTINPVGASLHANFFQLTPAAAFSLRGHAGLLVFQSSLVLMHGNAGIPLSEVYFSTNGATWILNSNPQLTIPQYSQAYVSDTANGVYYFTVEASGNVYRVNATVGVTVLPAFTNTLVLTIQDHSMVLLNSRLHIIGGM